jgi:hypothetical protein
LKRILFFLILVFGLAALASAQGREPGRNQRALPSGEAVTVSGMLTLAQGMPAIIRGDTTYLIFGISRLSGFVDGLREGAQVTVAGTALSSQRDNAVKFLRPSTLTLNGRNYDLALPRQFNDLRGQIPPRDSWRQHAPRTPQGRPRHGRVL